MNLRRRLGLRVLTAGSFRTNCQFLVSILRSGYIGWLCGASSLLISLNCKCWYAYPPFIWLSILTKREWNDFHRLSTLFIFRSAASRHYLSKLSWAWNCVLSVKKKINWKSESFFFFGTLDFFHCSESETQGLSRKVSSEHLLEKKKKYPDLTMELENEDYGHAYNSCHTRNSFINTIIKTLEIWGRFEVIQTTLPRWKILRNMLSILERLGHSVFSDNCQTSSENM